MSLANKTTENAGIWNAQIDKATWLELARLCERIVDSFGVIGANLELALEKRDEERSKYLVEMKDVSVEGHTALKQFAQLWTRLDEQAYRDGVRFCPKEVEDARQEGRRNPIPETRAVSRPAQSAHCSQVLSLEFQAENDGCKNIK